MSRRAAGLDMMDSRTAQILADESIPGVVAGAADGYNPPP